MFNLLRFSNIGLLGGITTAAHYPSLSLTFELCTQVVVTDDLLKSGWVAALAAAVNHSKAAVAVIKPFEDGIRRPYFHVKPLDSAQVLNWSGYLDHAEKSADRAAAVKLYERCLVACAGYPGQYPP